MNMYYLYILRSATNKLYIGQSNNLKRRPEDHRRGAIRYTNYDRTFTIIYSEEYSARLDAMSREKQLKGWTRAKKEALIANNTALLKRL